MKTLAVGNIGKYVFPIILASILGACDSNSKTNIVERDPVPNPTPVIPTPEPGLSESGARLLVTKPGHHDHIVVFDLAEKEAIADLHVESVVTGLYATTNKRYAIAVQGGDNGVVNFIDSGVEWEDHGGHGHLYLDDPQVLGLELVGARPAHVTIHADKTVIFFDGIEGSVPAEIHLMTDTGIAAGTVLATHHDSIRQHGAAQAWGDYLVSTVRLPEEPGPTQILVSERDGDHFHAETLFDQPEYACPQLHGSAQNSGYIAFGCGDGVLFVEAHGDHFHAHKITNSTRISSIFSDINSINFVGAGRNSSTDPISLFAINPLLETIAPIAYDKTPRAYAFAKDGELFLILDTEGGLTAFDTEAWTVIGTRLQVTAATEASGQTFRLTVSGNGKTAYVADVGAQEIRVVDIHDWKLDADKTISLDFAPGLILWVGSTEEEDGHNHH
ncbi:MAG: hypothetical protein NVV73_07400 [Cellvibrionaceae bacterium]|nr:hypothetical protein [Cellvibrionaceae bacterium]